MAQREEIYASIHFSKDATLKIREIQEEYKKIGIRVTIQYAVNKLIEKNK